ncbi:hypothetical protein CK203_025936 [Vitis vinifera]|uniref:KIB1-4 beta-propeller domain-containing protein n=1 Tax=Vitis vinifera TaxID=29760 RepID=A0A438IKR4_VITVI|nr:hypothetical protein CK203_025936 [Vitis vinifera]
MASHSILTVDRSKRSTKTSSGMVIRSGSNPLPSVRFARIEKRGWITAGSLLSRAKACASRCGWVLFSERTRRLIDSTLYHVYQHYVYHPLAKDIISLPRLDLQQHNHHLEIMATFSSNPTSPDCVFVAPTFYFVAYSGHLHLVYLGRSRVDKVPLCNIFRYNWMDGAWKKMESLDDGAMFLGKPSFGISAGEQTKMVANRVNYFCSHTSSPKFLVYGSAATGDKY